MLIERRGEYEGLRESLLTVDGGQMPSNGVEEGSKASLVESH